MFAGDPDHAPEFKRSGKEIIEVFMAAGGEYWKVYAIHAI